VDDLFRIGLSNAVAASVLALVALLVGRLVRRPALAHALWLLVLVKLITPPLRCIEFDWPLARESVSEEASPEPIDESADSPDDPEMAFVAALERVERALPAPAASEPTDAPLDAAPASDESKAPEESDPVSSFVNLPWITLLGAAWLLGSAAWLVLAARRTYRFHCLLRRAQPAPADVRAEVKRWAVALGLRHSPRAWLVPGRVAPMLWMLGGRPRLYLPAELWPKLDEAQRTAVVVHELAHVRRGDHWVRALEIVTTCLYWWHPVVWLARRELREAEEQCCDAWVVWAMPEAARNYALALVETLDFLSEARVALPAAASGVGPTNDLRRRLTMIMQGSTPRRLGWSGLLGVVGVAAVLLPFVPTLARSQDSGGGARSEPQEARGRGEDEPARAELERARQELERARERLRAVERRVQEANQRREGGDGGGRFTVIIRDENGRDVRRVEAQRGQLIRVPDGQAQRGGFGGGGGFGGQGGFGGGVGIGAPGGVGPQPGAGGGPPGAAPGGMGGGGRGGARGMMGGTAGAGGGPGGMMGAMAGPGGGGMAGAMMPGQPGFDPPQAVQERRFQQLERRLDEVTRALDQLRQQLEQRQPPGRRGPDQPQPRNRGPQRGGQESRDEVIKELKPGNARPVERDPAPRNEPPPAVPARPPASPELPAAPRPPAEDPPAPGNAARPPASPPPSDDGPPRR